MRLFRLLAIFVLIMCGPAAFAELPPTTAKNSTTGVEEEKYENGQTKSHYALNPAGLRSGPYTLFSDDGKRTERGSYKNGELDGQRQTFYPNTRVKLQENYKKGAIDGPVTELDEKGTSVRAAEFKAGIPVSDRTTIDGIVVYPRSIAMIQNELARIGKLKIETVAASAPIPPHAGGNTSQEDREDAVRRLMEYRYLCNVPYEPLVLDPLYCAHDEAASAICAELGHLTHEPENPGWPVDRFKFAAEGSSHSNIYMAGGKKETPQCVNSINAYMNDSDPGNVDRVGHRRWCLNPYMGKVGIASFQNYSAMWSFDASRKQIPDYDFIAYPAPGYFPSPYFRASYAWSISINPTKYAPPATTNVKIAVTPVKVDVAQNKVNPSAKPLELNSTKVNATSYGIGNCIIFRPVGITIDPGTTYLVEITGLQTRDRKTAVIKYVVEFFVPELPAKP